MGRRGAKSALLISGLLLLLAGSVLAGTSDDLQRTIQENTKKLASLRAQIQQQQARMASIDDQAAAVRRSHTEIEQEIAEARQRVSDMVRTEAELTQQSDQLAVAVQEHQERYESQKRLLAKNLRNMYVRGERGELEMVLTAGSFSDLMTRLKVSRMLARMEAGVVAQARQDGAKIAAEQHLLKAALAEIWQSRAEKTAENDRLAELMAEKTAALRTLANEKKGLKNAMLDLSLHEQKLNYVLEDLERQRADRAARSGGAEGSSFAALVGQMEWPVQGEVIRGFGRSVHPRFKTVTLNNGVNIAAGSGTAVAAVAAGQVQFADHLPGFGECVIVDHGAGYYSLYANLADTFVARGEKVARGQVIAEVGRPDNGGPAQLYFEIRQGRTPLDPGSWLKAR